MFTGFFGFFLVAGIAFLMVSLKVVSEYERGVVFRLGRLIGAKGPGLVIIVPVVDRFLSIDLRTVTLDVPPQDIITRDNVTIKVNAVVYFRVIEPNRAVTEVENYFLATSQLAQTTLRSVVGQVELDHVLAARDDINQKIQTVLDTQTEPWGVKVTNVELKQVDLPLEMQRAMAKQAEAERERRAKIIAAEGEFQASQKLAEAAEVLNQNPVSIQLRYLQTMVELSNEKTSTVMIPYPANFMGQMMNMFGGGGGSSVSSSVRSTPPLGAPKKTATRVATLKMEGDKTMAHCPNCQAKYNVTDVVGNPRFDLDPREPGQQIKCSVCNDVFTIPEEKT